MRGYSRSGLNLRPPMGSLHVPDLLLPVMEDLGAVVALVDLFVRVLWTDPGMGQHVSPLLEHLSTMWTRHLLVRLMLSSDVMLEGLLAVDLLITVRTFH